MKKRVLFLIDSLTCGGAEKSLISLLPLLDYSQIDVDLLMFKRGGVFEKYVPQQVRVISHRLYGSGFVDRLSQRLHQMCFSWNLRFGKKRHGAETHWRAMHQAVMPLERQYDVAIAYQQGMPTFFLATKVNAAKKVAWINADVLAAGYDMDYCKQFYDKMDAVVAVSQKLFDLLSARASWMQDKLHCVYDIINPEVVRTLAQEQVTDMNPVGDALSIVTVGRLTKPKNHLLALDAAHILKENGLDFKWYFVGEGEMRTALEQRITDLGLAENVILLGLKENPYPYMAKADVYVQTSAFEGFGMTIAEAKMLQRPVVSTNFDVIHDQIVDHQNGLIADMTPQNVAEKILELIADEELSGSISKSLANETYSTVNTEPAKVMRLITA